MMKSGKTLHITRLLLLAVLLSPLAGAIAGGNFKVVVSIKPIHSILTALMEGVAEPQLLVSGKDTPYAYQLTQAQKRQIAEADMVVWAGSELEPFLVEPLMRVGPDTRVIEMLDSLALKILPRRWDHEQRDPFFWLDSRNVLIMVDELTRTLMDADPARHHLYVRNRHKVFKEIAEIDRRLEYGYRGMQQGVALLYYDSLHYFAQAYAMRLGAIFSPLPPQPVSAKKLLKARSNLKDGDFSCILTEAGMPNSELSLLTEGIEVNVGELDSLGINLEAGPDFYVRLMEYNTRVIRECLGDGPAEGGSPILDSGLDASRETLRGRFLLTDHLGHLVTEEQLLGHYTLLYFGYTYCPDICPTSLQVASVALGLIGEKAEKIQPWFITIDPQRDKTDVIGNYVKYFDERFLGLTGTPAMIERVAQQYRVRYEKVLEEGGDPDLYVMDHTASLFLIGPNGQFITKFAYGITAKDLAKRLLDYL